MKYIAIVFGLMGGTFLGADPPAMAQTVGGIVSQEEAQRHGLERAWFAQVNSTAVGPIVDLIFDRDTLFAHTGRGTLQAWDAETGLPLWNVAVGDPRHPSTPVAASAKHVATVNGTTVYLIDRKTGREVWNEQLKNSAGAAPALTSTHVFVPLADGAIWGFKIDNKKKTIPWRYQSFGNLVASPLATSGTLSWATESGYMYFMSLADPEHLHVNYRLKTDNVMTGGLSHWTPRIYSASIDGYVYAADEVTGEVVWKFSAGEAIVDAPVAVADRLFVCTERGGMHCVNTESGMSEWYVPNVMQFISVSPTRIYASDRLNHLLILDAKTGARLDTMALDGVDRKLRNFQSDRIFLTSKRGAIQCLRETELTQPIVYTPPPLASALKPKVKQEKLTEKEPAGTETEEAAEEAPAEEPAAEETPAEESPPEGEAPADENNPFG